MRSLFKYLAIRIRVFNFLDAFLLTMPICTWKFNLSSSVIPSSFTWSSTIRAVFITGMVKYFCTSEHHMLFLSIHFQRIIFKPTGKPGSSDFRLNFWPGQDRHIIWTSFSCLQNYGCHHYQQKKISH